MQQLRIDISHSFKTKIMKPSFKKAITAALLAGVTAALINAVLFFIFKAAGLIDNDVLIPQNNQPLGALPVLLSSLIPSLLAGLVWYLFERYTNNGFRYFSILAIVLLVLSFANPFLGIPGIPVAMALALNCMHIVVVLSLLYFFKRAKGEQKPAL